MTVLAAADKCIANIRVRNGRSWACVEFRVHGVHACRTFRLYDVAQFATFSKMKRKHHATLASLFAHPTSANVKWRDVEALFVALGARIEEAEGSRVVVELFGVVRVFHRPHPRPDTDKGAVASIRKWLETNGVVP